MQVCERAASEGRVSEALLLEWPRLALRFGRVKKALEASAHACQSLPCSAQVWQQRLLLTAQQASAQVSYPPLSLSNNVLSQNGRAMKRFYIIRIAAHLTGVALLWCRSDLGGPGSVMHWWTSHCHAEVVNLVLLVLLVLCSGCCWDSGAVAGAGAGGR